MVGGVALRKITAVEEALSFAGMRPDGKSDQTGLFISSKVIRCAVYQGCPSVFVEGQDDDVVRNAVVDGVHWVRHTFPGAGSVCVYAPAGVSGRVGHALSTLAAASRAVKVHLFFYDLSAGHVKRSQGTAHPPDFALASKVYKWVSELTCRPTTVPPLGLGLTAMLQARVPAFRWYRNVTSGFWSGRVGGWQVCTLADGADKVRFGETEKERRANPPVSRTGLANLVAWIEAFARKRTDPKTREGRRKHEHLLESGVWRGPRIVPVTLPGAVRPLEPIVQPAEPPLQVPALYSDLEEAPARFVDAVMKDGTTPWAIELKVESGGQGQYYRHAITQAVLYREFLRQATGMHKWFRGLGLDPTRVSGAVAFPALRGGAGHTNHILSQLQKTADSFGIKVIELPMDWGTLHKRCMQ